MVFAEFPAHLETLHQVMQCVGADHSQVVHQGGLCGVLAGHDKPACLLLSGLAGNRENAAAGPDAPVQSEFASAPESTQDGGIQLSAGHQ